MNNSDLLAVPIPIQSRLSMDQKNSKDLARSIQVIYELREVVLNARQDISENAQVWSSVSHLRCRQEYPS